MARLDPKAAEVTVRRALTMGLIDLTNHIVADKLSGQVLHVQTGTLRRSIHYRLDESGDQIVGLVGSFAGYTTPNGRGFAASYARVNEYGGRFNIPSYTRRIGYNADSERIKLLTKGGSVRQQVDNYSTTVVKAHTADFPQRSFLRSALSERRAAIFQGVRTALVNRVGKGWVP